MKIHMTAALALLWLAIGATMAAAQAIPAPKLPTLWIIGDSTVKNGTKGLEGWGDPIQSLFDRSKIDVENRALGGRSSRTFLTEGLWDKVLAGVKSGDYVLMQFGHNDGGSPRTSYRASLKGVGEEMETVPNPKTQKSEVIHTYGWYLRKYIEDAKAKGATPIVLSPIPRNIWTDDNNETFRVMRNTSDYGGWAADVAKAESVPFINLNALIADKYDALGPDKVKAEYFPGDHTHTSPAGAELNAACVAQGIRELAGCPLSNYLLPVSAAAR